jgi:hypothetical protein
MRSGIHILAKPPRQRKAARLMFRLTWDQQVKVTHLLCEGSSIRSVQRLTGIHRDTIMRHVVRVGGAVRAMLDERMRGLRLDHLQCDEIWTFVRKKQAHLSDDEAGDDGIGDQFLFIALDEETKLIPTFVIGKRNKETTERFMLDLAARIVTRFSARPGTGR